MFRYNCSVSKLLLASDPFKANTENILFKYYSIIMHHHSHRNNKKGDIWTTTRDCIHSKFGKFSFTLHIKWVFNFTANTTILTVHSIADSIALEIPRTITFVYNLKWQRKTKWWEKIAFDQFHGWSIIFFMAKDKSRRIASRIH